MIEGKGVVENLIELEGLSRLLFLAETWVAVFEDVDSLFLSVNYGLFKPPWRSDDFIWTAAWGGQFY